VNAEAKSVNTDLKSVSVGAKGINVGQILVETASLFFPSLRITDYH
jgi:hypothetical protein